MKLANNHRERSGWIDFNSTAFRSLLMVSLVVMSLPAMTITPGAVETGVAVASEDDSDFFDDFEDSNHDGWEPLEPDGSEAMYVVNEGFYGDHSLQITDEAHDDDAPHVIWSDGADVDLGGNFEIEGTYYASDDDSSGTGTGMKFGIADPDAYDETAEPGNRWPNEEGHRALVNIDTSRDEIYLTYHVDEDPDELDQKIEDDMADQWNEFRMQIDGGEVRVKIWEAGTSEPDSWDIERSFDEEFTGKFYADSGASGEHLRTLQFDEVDSGGHTISGQVVDQNGDPVPNATVDLVGADYNALEDQADDLDAEADEILREIETIEPDEWDADLDPVDAYDDANAEYVAVHTASDWELHGSWERDGVVSIDDPLLDEPRIIVDGDEQIMFSVWDASEAGGLTGQDSVDESLPGETTSGEIVVTQLGPDGETMSERTYETEPKVEISSPGNIGWGDIDTRKQHEAATANLPPGLYRVAPADNPERSIVISVGDPDELIHGWQSDLRDEHDQLTEHSENLNERIESGELSRTTTTTDEDGYFELNVPMGVERATVIAYGDYGNQLDDVTGPSLADLQALQEDEQGAVYLTGSPQRTDVPADNVDLEVQKVDGMPFTGPENFEEWIEDAVNEALNETTAELEALFGERLDEMDQGDLEDLHDQYADLVEENEELNENVEELIGEFDSEDPPDNQDELIEEIEAIEESLNELEESLEPDDPASDIEDGLLSYEVTFPTEINEDAVAATVVYQDGETQAIGDEHISVEQRDLITDDTTIVIDDYPVPEDKAVADVRVQVATEDGFGESRDQIINPGYADDIPRLDAIDVSTDRPGPTERVGLSVRPEDGTGYGQLSDVRAFNPDGEQTTVEIDGERARIDMDGDGVHRIEVEYENQQGDVFREVVNLRAADSATTTGPTVRATQGPAGIYAVAGEGLDSAAIDVRDVDGSAKITALAPGGDEPNELHVYPDAALSGSTDRIDVQVLKGDREEAVNRHVSVVIHTERMDDDTILWRNGDPITHDGDTRYGEVDEREDGKYVIFTYTDERGTVDVTARHNPGLIDRATHRVALVSPIGLPSVLPVPAAAGLTVGLVALPAAALTVRKRRR